MVLGPHCVRAVEIASYTATLYQSHLDVALKITTKEQSELGRKLKTNQNPKQG